MERIALVTGGTRGIGAAISKTLQSNGYTVAANYVGNQEKAEQFTIQTGIKAYRWDVSDAIACKESIDKIKEEIGVPDTLVNNAGIIRDSFFHKMKPEQWYDLIGANLNSLYNVTINIYPEMRNKGFGRIINISSLNGIKGQLGQTNYAASKAGVIGFTKSLAQEAASKGITVNAIAPGYINTDMVASIPDKIKEKIIANIPVGRLGNEQEIADAVCYLASTKAGFITGSTFNINGGQYMS